MINWLKEIIDNIWELIWGFVQMVIRPADTWAPILQSAFPSLAEDLSAINPYVDFVDRWIDINTCLAMTQAYMAYLVLVTSYKFLKSWIPSVSGA